MLYDPTDKQKEFHKASDDWIIIGGSIGSGKSLAMLIESLGIQYNSHVNGNWRALIVRRTYPQLVELIIRSKELFPKIVNGIKYNESQHTWTMPSGSTIRFGSCETDADVEKYRGFEYNMICVDELSHFDNDYVWNFLSTRNRNSKGLPNRMIGTSNPCIWVKEMMNVDDKGSTNRITKMVVMDEKIYKFRMLFLQMNTADNPHLPPEYRARLSSLPASERDALLYGYWKHPEVRGSIYGAQVAVAETEGRICNVPYDNVATTYVSFDLGIGDHCSLIFGQVIRNEIRIFKTYENNNQPISHYIEYIKKMISGGINVNEIILPHDSNSRSLQTGISTFDIMKDAFKGMVKVNDPLARIGIEEGINRVKDGFNKLWISQAETHFLKCLREYRRKYDKTSGRFSDPIHDEYSDMMDSLRYFMVFITDKLRAPVKVSLPKRSPNLFM